MRSPPRAVPPAAVPMPAMAMRAATPPTPLAFSTPEAIVPACLATPTASDSPATVDPRQIPPQACT
eukprot:885367-Alexandrium_andersonii.AAC.1